jgi:hypothetical protein
MMVRAIMAVVETTAAADLRAAIMAEAEEAIKEI